jgi:hypothetical protein
MIVQNVSPNAAADAPRFIITQVEHARATGTLAEAYGNDSFAPLDPFEPMTYMIGHHDEGWTAVDAAAAVDPATRLPYHLTQTPADLLVITSTGSPNHNEMHHPLSGLISSMHTYGLYNGRYGLSDKVYIDTIAPEMRPRVDAMLGLELARQNTLKKQLRANPELAAFADEDCLFYFYKLLQFFDTLGLYFHLTHGDLHAEATFKNVPRQIKDDVTIAITPLGEDRYALNPFPFDGDVTFSTRGRYLAPLGEGVTKAAAALADIPFEEQTVMLVAD